MKILIITMGLTLLTSSVKATTTEVAAKEFGAAIVDSLVELQLQMACDTHISSSGAQVVKVDSKCI